jgi:hypothetical protein
MKNSVGDRNLVRQFLLGRLDESVEVEDKLSEQILFNDEMAEIVDSVEDDIIEEYLDGSLDSADRNAVDQYFLRPPERKEKLRFARLLRHHFETKGARPFDTKQNELDMPPIAWRSHMRTYAQLAALVLVSISSLVYVTSARRSQARLEGELAQERERSISLEKQTELLQPPIVPLTLVADRSRGVSSQIPQLEIKSSTRRIIVEIAVQGGVPGPYDVSLETAGGKGPLWSATLLALISPSGDAKLVFDVPTQGIESDVYSFVISLASPEAGEHRHYDFQVKRAK